MARPLRIEYPGAFYHITSRGNERKNIFINKGDRERFHSYLKSASLRYGAVIHAFCLMNNHYHLFLETPIGNLSKIMLHINGAYTNYFNIRHKRRGHLFQGRYKAILVEADAYAVELSRYIHLNPVRAKMVDMPEKFKWSSYQYYIGKRKKPEWLMVDLVLNYFKGNGIDPQIGYKDFVLARMIGKYESPLRKTVASTILGSDDFVEFIKDRYLDHKSRDRSVPAIAELKNKLDIKDTNSKVYTLCNNDTSLSRKITIYLFHKYSGMQLKEIGSHFGIGDSAISESSKQFEILLKQDRKLRKEIELMREHLMI